jgi:hypothetical protein
MRFAILPLAVLLTVGVAPAGYPSGERLANAADTGSSSELQEERHDGHTKEHLTDLLERHRVFPGLGADQGFLERLLKQKWHLYGVWLPVYKPRPMLGEPLEFPYSEEARQVSNQAMQALQQAGAGVFRVLAREPDLYVHSVCFGSDWGGGDECLLELLRLRKIVLVCFYYTEGSDAAVGVLESLDTLTDLEFRHSGITDKTLARLSKIKSLRRLTLVEESITLAGVRRLLPELPKIKKVRLDGSLMALDDKQTQALREAFPHVEFQIVSRCVQ